ncbi:hypothetical protein [Serratia marcescens]|uniref:hypothetical protein n=1 Tax=Serratia marcescens TaxID=615 RepID=UPI002FD97ECF
MENKLSELSKPVGFVSDRASTQLKEGYPASIRPFFDVQGSKPLYSQEYVSALLAENEAKDKRIAELSVGKVGNALLERENHHVEVVDKLLARIAELEAKRATPVRLKKVDSSNVPFAGDGFNAAVDYCAKAVRAAGFTVEGDE